MATYAPVAYTTAANNTQIDFDITFTFLRNQDLAVSVIDPSGNVLVAGTGYDTQLQTQSDGTFDMRVVQAGTLTTTNTPLAAGHVISIKRNTDISTILTVFQDGASFKAADINAIINQLFNNAQETAASVGEGIGLTDDLAAFDANNKPLRNLAAPTADTDAVRKIDVDSGIGADITTVAGIASDVTTLSSGTDTSGRLHRLNIEDVADDLNLGANSDITTVATDIRTGGNNHVQTVSNNIADVNTLAGNDTDGTAHLVNIETVAEDLAGSNTIGAVAGSIANVNTLAGSDAGGTAHLTNISDLAPQVSNISTLTQTANLTALQNAATNAAAAEAALNAFNATYVGSYATDPSVDANGNALTDGDLYYDTTNQRLKFFDAANSSWITLANSVQVNSAATLQGVGDVDFANSGGFNRTLAGDHFIVRDTTNARWENANVADVQGLLSLPSNTSGDITALDGRLTTAESNITSNDTDIAANASAISTLQSEMSTAQSDITTNATAISSKIANVADDTSPQLGANLDVNGNSIVSASGGNIAITPDGAGKIVLDGLSWPTADGTADQVLKTDGSGNLAFVDQSSGGGPSFIDLGDFSFTEVTSTGNITIPSGATKAFIYAIGAGGSGGNATGTDTACFVCGGFGGNGSAGITIADLTAVTGLHATIANGDAEVRLGSSSGTLIAKGVNGGDGASLSSGGNQAGGAIGSHATAFTAGRVNSSGSFTATTTTIVELPSLAASIPAGIVGGNTGNQFSGDDAVTMAFRDPRAIASTFLSSSHGGQLDVQKQVLSVTYHIIDPNSAAGSSAATAQTGFGLGGIGGMVSDSVTTRNGASGGPAAVVVLFQ